MNAFVFVTNAREPDVDEIRILYDSFMVCIFDGDATVEPYQVDDFKEILRNHRDPTMGWEEMPCSW